MLQIGNALVSLDLIEQFFCCDLDKCLGECCIEGDAGAPITKEEYAKIKEILPEVWDDLLPAAKRVIEEQGVGYVDEEGIDCRRAQLCVYVLWRERDVSLRHREGIPCWKNRLLQANLMPSLPCPPSGISRLHRRQLPSLENLQMRGSDGQKKPRAAVSVS